jgi:hypothetical protein
MYRSVLVPFGPVEVPEFSDLIDVPNPGSWGSSIFSLVLATTTSVGAGFSDSVGVPDRRG